MAQSIHSDLSRTASCLLSGAATVFFLCSVSVFGQEAVSTTPNEPATTSQTPEPTLGQEPSLGEHPSISETEAQAILSETPPSSAVTTGGGGYSSTPRRLKYNIGLQVRGVYDDNINLTKSD